MKIELKPIRPQKPGMKPETMPTSMNIRSLPELEPPTIKAPGPKFRYKGAREK